MRSFLATFFVLFLLLPLPALALDQSELLQKIEALSKELERLKQQMQEIQQKEAQKEERITVVEKKAEQAAEGAGHLSWLEIGGDYRGRYDYLKGTIHEHFLLLPGSMVGAPSMSGQNPILYATPFGSIDRYDVKNDSLLTNRLGLNLKIKATEDIQVKARLLMYKVWGHQTEGPVQGAFFADRAFGSFDGSIGHIPEKSELIVDQAYATWSNVAGLPMWFSVGRRPSTGGVPGTLRQNIEKPGTAGVPNFLVDYAFDGLTIGFAPDIEALPGAYAKICYGKGFDSGFRHLFNNIRDVNMLGVNLVPYDTDNLHVELQWNRAFDIFDNMPDLGVRTNLGDIDQYGLLVMGKINNVGPGDLNLFAAGGLSKTHPNNNMFTFNVDASALFGQPFGNVVMPAGAGLLWDAGKDNESRTGSIIYLGARYDIKSTGTKIGVEWNHGSKNWIAFAPAADDIWTSKLGTRGDVYEAYIIQELGWLKPISKKGKAFFRLGYQYYNFKYTGSNSWIGEPKKIDDLKASPADLMAGKAQMFQPIDKAHDIYFTFDVQF